MELYSTWISFKPRNVGANRNSQFFWLVCSDFLHPQDFENILNVGCRLTQLIFFMSCQGMWHKKELLHHDVKQLDVCGVMLKQKLYLNENEMCSIAHIHTLMLYLKSLACFSFSASVGLKKSVCLNLKYAKFKINGFKPISEQFDLSSGTNLCGEKKRSLRNLGKFL